MERRYDSRGLLTASRRQKALGCSDPSPARESVRKGGRVRQRKREAHICPSLVQGVSSRAGKGCSDPSPARKKYHLAAFEHV